MKCDAETLTWSTVALQDGTIALSSQFYDAQADLHAVMVWSVTTTAATKGDTSLSLAQTDGMKVGQYAAGVGIPHTAKVQSISDTRVITLDQPIMQNIPSHTLIGVSARALTDIATRDGSWEIYVLTDALRYGSLFIDAEINEIFFAMLNFVHVQQDGVDWAFKTSFMNIIGYDIPLQQTPVLLSDQTDSLLNYINEVKPYHVKIRELGSQYKPDTDETTCQMIEQQYHDLTLLFDRYSNADAWDVNPFDAFAWDDGDDGLSHIYSHTTLIGVSENILHVDNVRHLQAITPVSNSNPLHITVDGIGYEAVFIQVDDLNVSKRPLGISGQLHVEGTITELLTIGSAVEAIITIPNAAARIASFDPVFDGLSYDQRRHYLGLIMQPSTQQYTLIADAARADTSLLLDRNDYIMIGQPITGPNIPHETVVTKIENNIIHLSHPILNVTWAGAVVTIALPSYISGSDLLLSDIPTVTYEGASLQGDETIDTSINPPLPSRPGGYDLRPPYHSLNHPEERLPVNGDDALHMMITAMPVAGGPPQIIKVDNISDVETPVTISLDLIPPSDDAVMVFCDRVRVSRTEYTVDRVAGSVTVNAGYRHVIAHVFGFGGTVCDMLVTQYKSNPITFVSTPTIDATVVVVGNDATDQYTISGNQITLTNPPPVVLMWRLAIVIRPMPQQSAC